MKLYYVYIVECKDKSYYTGITNNLNRRLWEHNSGYAKRAYTFTRRPVVLKWQEQFTDPNYAIMVEKQIKGWSRRKKQALINSNWKALIKFSKSYGQFGKPDENLEE
ncbi:GIY-YIG nuclease family protein [Salegentibacter sp. BLCTC]|uniref:GIY-YIG nuclease family protein n=1 Tax=Salegentibacter maritimus TaxID=2794347 RepID=A0ABS0TCI2_9FLAO|nr:MULTISPECIES: GIY-YIG nuclease family protein [Salegentibacter]MBE7639830.1 GIY-YIG nuclease family protein [Salegentibacter sp. BLCTC]MBI6118540.1 GIY-YIG nuclease family protein [Salegentibacter maritimus]